MSDEQQKGPAREVTVASGDVRAAVGEAVRVAKDAQHVTVRDESGRARFHIVRPREPLGD